MKITQVENCPTGLHYFDKDDLESKLEPQDIEDIVEIFQTPLTGTYNWDYTDADNRLKKLYELGKKLNWNATLDLDWTQEPYSLKDWATNPEIQQLSGFKPYDDLSEEKKIECSWHLLASGLSQIVHGEQGALLVASQLVSCAPTYNAKLYAASQTFDEARHVEVFARYLQRIHGLEYPCNKNLKALLDKTLTDPRRDLKFIGMQIVIEGLALAAFQTTKETSNCPLLRQLVHYVIRDEARHVTFGINYLTEFLQTLTEEELEDRAQFAYEACVVMRNRILNTELPAKWFGISEEEILETVMNNETQDIFNNLLFNRVMPNLKKIGLLTDKVLPLYEKLGLLGFADADSDFEVDWAVMTKPLESSKEIDKQSEQELKASQKIMEEATASLAN